MNEERERDVYLGRPCPIAGHPIAVEMILFVGILIDSSHGKGPLSFKNRVSKETLDDF